MSNDNYISSYSGSQVDNVLGLFHGKGLDQVTGLVQRNADGTFSQGSGGGGSDDVFVGTYETTTYSDLLAAINADKRIIIVKTVDTNDVLYYVNRYQLYNNVISLDAIGYNSYAQFNFFLDGQRYYSNNYFKMNYQFVKLIINYDDKDFYDIQNKIQYFDENIDTISFIKDPSYGFGLILSYSSSSTSSEDKIEFTALLNSMSNTLPYRIKYTVIKNSNTGNVTWSRSSTQLQDKLVSGTSIKTFNNQSLLGSGNISETDPVFVASAAYGISASDITNWNSKSDFSGSFIDLTNKPTTLSGYGITDAQETLVSGTNIKTINNTSLLGSGNISVLDADSTFSAAKLTGAITNGVTATTQSSGDNSTKIATTAYVDGAINDLPEPMVFEGSLGTGGTITTLPAASSTNKGFTYKVITDGTYASQAAKVGDTFISDGTAWVLIPSGDEPSGTVTSVATGAGLSGGPITSSGTISLATAFGDTVNPYGSKTANYVLAAPNGSNGTPSFRALVAADLPNGNWLNGSATGSLRSVGSTPYTIGNYAVAEGRSTQASGEASHAEGYGVTARGDYSHAQNELTIAAKNAQTAIGKYNIEDTETIEANQKALIIGNGTSISNRSNAFTVDWGGNTEQQGRAKTKDLTSAEIDALIQELGLHGRSICPYDVGDIYVTRNATNPANKWDGTTWEKTERVNDYIVEQGQSGIWNYKKYASGLVELWGVSSESSTPYGSKIYDYWYGHRRTLTFPFPIKHVTGVYNVGTAGWQIPGTTFPYSDDDTPDFINDSMIYGLVAASGTRTVTFKIKLTALWKDYVSPATIYEWRRLS